MLDVFVVRAYSIKDIFELQESHEGPCYLLAGGTDLIVQERKGFMSCDTLWIDINRINELKTIKENDDYISIGSLVTHSEIEKAPLIKKYAPALAEASSTIGSPQIRNRATIGGNINNASPAGDTLPALYSMDANVVIHNNDKESIIPIRDYHTGPGRVCQKAKNCIITEVRIPKIDNIKGAFSKLGQRKALAVSIVSVAVSYSRELHIGISAGAVSPTPIRAYKCEEFLGNDVVCNDEVFEKAALILKDEICPINDIRGSSIYRSEMAAVLFKRAIKRVLQ